jgi:hypothetical protein
MNADDAEARIARTTRGRKYFDTLWNPGPAQDMRDGLVNFVPIIVSLCFSYIVQFIV